MFLGEEVEGGTSLSVSCVADHSEDEKNGGTEERVRNNSSEEDLQWKMSLVQLTEQQVPHDSLQAEISQVRSCFR